MTANTFRRLRGGLVCDYTLEKRQLRLRLSGPMTPGVMPQIANDLNRIGDGALTRSIVLDLRSAAVALTYEQLLEAPERLVPALRLQPVAIVCPPATTELFREYAWATAKLGLLRGVFPVQGPAEEWAGLQGRSGLRFRTEESAR
jgi:hypothetical protein